MTKLSITKEEILEQYKIDLDKLLDDCDWIDHVEDWRLCDLVRDVCVKKGLIVDSKYLLKRYEDKVKSLNLTDEQWRKEYANWETGLPKIFDIIYSILEESFIVNKSQ